MASKRSESSSNSSNSSETETNWEEYKRKYKESSQYQQDRNFFKSTKNREFDRLKSRDPTYEARTKQRELRLAQLDAETRNLNDKYQRNLNEEYRILGYPIQYDERRQKLRDEQLKIREEQLKIREEQRDDDIYFSDKAGYFGALALHERRARPGTSGIIYSSHPRPGKPVNSLYKNQTKPVNRASTIKNILSSRKGGRRNSRATRRRR